MPLDGVLEMTARMVKKRARSWEIYRGIVTSHPGEERGREKGLKVASAILAILPASLAAKKPIGWCQPVIYTSRIPHPRPVASKGDSAMRVARLSLAAATS